MAPAHQRLGADHRAATLDDRLPVQRQLAAQQRAAQLVLDAQPLTGARRELWRIEAERAAASLLGVLQGGFRVLRQLGEIAAVTRVEGDADRSAGSDRMAVDSEWPPQHVENSPRQSCRFFCRPEPRCKPSE